jgi:hypothetical protein
VTSPVFAFIDVVIAEANSRFCTPARAADPDQPTASRRTDRSGLRQIHARRELLFIKIAIIEIEHPRIVQT